MIKNKILGANGEEFKFDSSSPEFQLSKETVESAFAGSMRNDDSFFMARDLEYIRSRVYENKFTKNQFLNGDIVDIDRSVPDFAETDVYSLAEDTGEATIISEGADDIPTVETSASEVSNKILEIGSSYIYTMADARRSAARVGRIGSVIDRKALAVSRSISSRLEKLLQFGAPKHGVYGYFNNPNVAVAAVAGNTWENKTSQQILDDIAKAKDDMADETQDIEEASRLMLDAPRYNLIQKKELDTTNYSGTTILKYVEDNYGLKVIKVHSLKGSFLGGQNGMVLDTGKDPLASQGVISEAMRVHNPETENLKIKTIATARCGGTRIYSPGQVRYVTGL